MYAWAFILFLFFVLVLVGIKYDQIVPRFMSLTKTRSVNIWYLVMGLFFIFVSLFSLSEKSGFSNFSPGAQSSERWGFPVHSHLWFIVLSLLGILSIIAAFLSTPKEKLNENFRKICVSCGKILKSKDNYTSCPKCGGIVEDIDGLMERHPDFLKKGKKNL
ncbi:MAG: hypothetical protein KJ882_07255 [Proteobacteria bacterium]|nr:hypothetical protein [Pseudomonadota bacterium]